MEAKFIKMETFTERRVLKTYEMGSYTIDFEIQFGKLLKVHASSNEDGHPVLMVGKNGKIIAHVLDKTIENFVEVYQESVKVAEWIETQINNNLKEI